MAFKLDPLLTPTDRATLIASVFGAVVSLFFLQQVNWRVAAQALLAGVASAYYGTATVAHLLGWSVDAYGLIGFAIGGSAMSLYGGVFVLFKSWREDPGGFIQRILSVIPAFRNKGD